MIGRDDRLLVWDWRGQVGTICAASTSTPAGSPRPTPGLIEL